MSPITRDCTNHHAFRLTYFLQKTTNAFTHNAAIHWRARKTSRFYWWWHRVRRKLSGFHRVKKEDGRFQCSQVNSRLSKCLWPPAPLSTRVWRTVGKMEWRVLIFQWYFMTASIPTLWKIQQGNQRLTEETAMVTLCDREDPSHTNQACHSLLIWRQQERIYKNIQNTQWVTRCKVESGGNGSIPSLKWTLSF